MILRNKEYIKIKKEGDPMVANKKEFIRKFLPDKIEDVSFAQIDMDITDLAIADVLRNINTTYPKNSRIRNAIIGGRVAVGVLCKTELIYPLSGIFLIVSNGETPINIVSKNYIVISISEERIVNDDEIKLVLDDITRYIIKEFKFTIPKFKDFYVKFVYDPYEEEAEFDGLESLDRIYRKLMGRE